MTSPFNTIHSEDTRTEKDKLWEKVIHETALSGCHDIEASKYYPYFFVELDKIFDRKEGESVTHYLKHRVGKIPQIEESQWDYHRAEYCSRIVDGISMELKKKYKNLIYAKSGEEIMNAKEAISCYIEEIEKFSPIL